MLSSRGSKLLIMVMASSPSFCKHVKVTILYFVKWWSTPLKSRSNLDVSWGRNAKIRSQSVTPLSISLSDDTMSDEVILFNLEANFS
mgnify:CR=1 FL=1